MVLLAAMCTAKYYPDKINLKGFGICPGPYYMRTNGNRGRMRCVFCQLFPQRARLRTYVFRYESTLLFTGGAKSLYPEYLALCQSMIVCQRNRYVFIWWLLL